MIDLTGMSLFVEVVRSGGFSAASRALGLPKSTLSRHVAALERRLGVALLRRNTRSFSVTEAGEAYYERCLAVVSAAQAADAEAMERADSPRGLVRITTTVGFGQEMLHGIVCSYLLRFPDMRVEIHLTEERVNLVRDGFDLAIRMGTLVDSELASRRLGAFSRVVCAAPDYLARRGQPRQPADLDQHDCVVVDRRLSTWRFSCERGEVSVHVSWRLCANHIEVVHDAVCGGQGIGNLPRFVVASDLADGRLVEVLADWPQPPIEMTAVYPASRAPSPPVRALIDLLVERTRDLSG